MVDDVLLKLWTVLTNFSATNDEHFLVAHLPGKDERTATLDFFEFAHIKDCEK